MFTDLEALSREQLHDLSRLVGPDANHRIRRRIDEAIAAKGSPNGERAEIPAKRQQPEKREQLKIKRLLEMSNDTVYDTSQPGRALITPGLPDLLCFCPKRGFFVVEVKPAGGRQTPDQRRFQERCEDAGIPYVLGGVIETQAWLAT